MLEIRIKPDTVKVKRLVAALERGDEVLSDVASREVVKQARRLAPTHLRTKILRRKQSRRWLVYVRDDAAQAYVESALQDMDWLRVMRLGLKEMGM